MTRQPPSLARRLLGPLRLELSQGCADRAAMGGLAGLVARWAAEVQAQGPPDYHDLARSLARRFAGYPQLAPERRQVLVTEALDALHAGGSGPLAWEDPVGRLRGVGARRAEILKQLGLHTVGDLLCFYPAQYEDRSCLQTLEQAEHRRPLSVQVTVAGPGEAQYRARPPRASLPVGDATGTATLVWRGQPYLARAYRPGDTLLVQGEARRYPSGLQILVRQAERLDPRVEQRAIVPHYATVEGISEEWLAGLIGQALRRCPHLPEGLLPPILIQAGGLAALAEAAAQAHQPPDLAAAHAARERLVVEALFAMQAQIARRRAQQRRPQPRSRVPLNGAAPRWIAALPFALTAAQQTAIGEVLGDLEADWPGHRLLHGEVGSGKTVVAGAALWAVAQAGRQAVLMAPTELLAEQHYRVLRELLRPLGAETVLLTGSLTTGQAAAVREALATGRVPLAIGTHALFQQGVEFADLALVVVDEQHRFGVRQRASLLGKGESANLLVMSATPIPRTLALTAYGDFDLSVLQELPPGRRAVHTELLTRRDRRRVYQTLAARVAAGERAFVVCPVIERGAAYLTAAEAWFERLQGAMPSLRWGLVHGKLPAERREATMDRFRRGEVEVLVATSVVEVGVDVPEATLMVVEDAERFGLAQLHQLRGRVARAARPALCLLVTDSRNPDVLERLQVLERTADGFEIAQEDLQRRGPGELLGSRQHGFLEQRLALAAADSRLLLRAREQASAVLSEDPELEQPQHRPLREHLQRAAEGEGDWTL